MKITSSMLKKKESDIFFGGNRLQYQKSRSIKLMLKEYITFHYLDWILEHKRRFLWIMGALFFQINWISFRFVEGIRLNLKINWLSWLVWGQIVANFRNFIMLIINMLICITVIH